MKKTRKLPSPPSAEAIARLAEQGKDVSRYFTNRGRMMHPVEPIRRVNVDFTAAMLKELDSAAGQLNISRQAVIKTLLCQALDHTIRPKEPGRRPVRQAIDNRQSQQPQITNLQSPVVLTLPHGGDVFCTRSQGNP